MWEQNNKNVNKSMICCGGERENVVSRRIRHVARHDPGHVRHW